MADKKEKAKAELKYQKEARYLAMSYTKLLEERDRLQKRIDGDWTYTKEMAIAELSSITASFDNERVHRRRCMPNGMPVSERESILTGR